jgi:autotransporter translocation and assembly factor TamB
MTWLKSCWHYIALGLITLVCLCILLIAFLLTPTGFKRSCQLAEIFTGEKLKVVEPEGSLSTTIHVKKVQWHSSDLIFDMTNFSAQIHVRSLIKGVVNIEQLDSTHINIQSMPSSNKQSSQSLAEKLKDLPTQSPWPAWLQVNGINIKQAVYQGEGPKPYVINNIQLKHSTEGAQPAYELTTKTAGAMQSNWQLYLLMMPQKINLHLVGNINQQPVELHGFINSQQLYIDHATIKHAKGYINSSFRYQFKSTPNFMIKNYFHNYQFHQKSLSGYINILLQSKDSFDAYIKIHTPENKNDIYLNLKHKKYWNATWKINLDKLSAYINSCVGSINSSGTLNNKIITGNGDINIQKLLLTNIELHAFKSQWSIDAKHLHAFKAITSFKLFNYNNYKVNNFNLDAQGNADKQNFNITLRTPWHQQVSAEINGFFSDKKMAWQGSLSKLNIQQSKQALWQLKKPVKITANTQTISITPLELSWKQYQFYLSGQFSTATSWKINSHASFLLHPTALQNPLFNGIYWTYQGNIQGSSDVVNTVKLHSGAKAILKLKSNKKLTGHPLNLNSDFSYNKGTTSLNSTLIQHKKTMANMNFQTDFSKLAKLKSFKQLPLNAKLDIHLPKLIYSQLITAFAPTITPKSALSATGSFKGTLSKPDISFSLNQPGDVYSELLNKTFNKTTLKIRTKDHIDLNMTTHIDNTPLTLKGSIKPSSHDYTSEWNFASSQVQIINQVEQQFEIKPNVTAHCTNLQCTLSGKIEVPKGRYKIQPLYASNNLPSEDIEYIHNNESKSGAGLGFSDLTIELGNNITLTGYGINGLLAGTIHLNQKIKSPLLLNGTLNLNKAYFLFSDNRLNLKTAQVSYIEAPANNPNIQIIGEKNIQIYALPSSKQQSGTVTVGLTITGTLKNPTIDLYSSSPALSQADILSYILFNQPASSASILNGATLISSLTSGDKKSMNPIDSIKKGLGLSEFGIESQKSFSSTGSIASDNNQFVLGKKLSKKLYLRYAMGLSSTSQNILMLIYQINNQWSLQSSQALQSNSQHDKNLGGSAVDLMYQFSR